MAKTMGNRNLCYLRGFLIFCCIFVGFFAQEISANTRPLRQSYACEGTSLSIKCDNPAVAQQQQLQQQRIRIVRANYGRFSVAVCNPDGVPDWPTRCMSHTSLQVLTDKCSDKVSCSVDVADRTFGDDPCPNVFKYLEVHYECTSDAVPAPRSSDGAAASASFFLPTQTGDSPSSLPSKASYQSRVFAITTPSSTTKTTSTPTTTTTTTPTSTSTTTPSTTSEITTPESSTTSPAAAEFTDTTQKPWRTGPRMEMVSSAASAILPGQSSSTTTESCPAVISQSIRWPNTPKGATAFQKCPNDSEGYAEWTCDDASPPQWKAYPDISQCTSPWINDIRRKASSDMQPEKLAEEFARQTARNSLTSGGDMSSAVDLINKIVNRGQRAMARMTSDDSTAQDPTVQKLGESVLKAGSNLLDIKHNLSWVEMSREVRSETATSLIVSLEKTAFMLAENVPVGTILTSSDTNIVMGAGKLQTRQLAQSYKFPPKSEEQLVREKDMKDSIELPAAALQQYSQNDVVRVVFLSYNNIGQYLELVGNNPKKNAGNALKDLSVNSKIISAAINSQHCNTELKEPVIITLEHIVPVDGSQQAVCAFWDYKSEKESDFQGAWSTRGCRLISSDADKTVCSCDHLTNFAVLMDVTGTISTSVHNDSLTKITFIGCSVSIFCLLLTLIIFCSFRSLQSERTTIHKNLAFCLMVAEIFFLAGISQTHLPIGCHIFSAIMHYFFLATFTWSLFEGINLWLLLVEVFDSEERSRRVWYYLAGYGAPLLIVAICLGVDWQSYATPNYCWLRADNYFILSFVIPAAAVVIVNIGFLSVAMYFMCANHARQTALHARDGNTWKHLKTWISGAIGLACVMSITWVFGFLYIGNLDTVIFAYVFTFFNSFQGVFIFALVCLRNDKVKFALRRFVTNQSARFSNSFCSSTRSTSSFSDNNTSNRQGFYQCTAPLDKEHPHYVHHFPPYCYGPRHDVSRRDTVTSTLPPHSPAPVLHCTCTEHDLPEKGSTRSSNRDSGHESVSCPSAESPPMQPIHIHQRTLYPPSVARKQASQVLQTEYPAIAARVAARNAKHNMYGDHRVMYCTGDPNEHIYAEIDQQQLGMECPYSESDESNTSVYQRGGSDISTDEDHPRRMHPLTGCDNMNLIIADNRKLPVYQPSICSEHKPLINSMGRHGNAATLQMDNSSRHPAAFRSHSATNPHKIRHTTPLRQIHDSNQAYINSPAMTVNGHNVPLDHTHPVPHHTSGTLPVGGNYNAFGLTSMCDGSKMMVRRLPLMQQQSQMASANMQQQQQEQPLSYSEC